MARLRLIGSRVKRGAPRIAPPPKRAESFYQSREWQSTVADYRAAMVRRAGRVHCERCGAGGAGVRLFLDHVVERKDGGDDHDPANLQMLCGRCHGRKTQAERAKRAAGPVVGATAKRADAPGKAGNGAGTEGGVGKSLEGASPRDRRPPHAEVFFRDG